MRIAFVSQPWETLELPVDGSSSIATMTYQFACRLARRGDAVTVYTRRLPGQNRTMQDADGITYRRVEAAFEDILLRPIKFAARLTGLGAPGRPVFASALAYRGFAEQIARDVARRGADVIHVHNFSQFVPVLRRHNPGARIVLHMHCEWLAQLDERTIARRLADADLVVGCSDHVTEAIRQRFPALRERCVTVYNSVDLDRFDGPPAAGVRDEGPPRLLYVGRLSPEKGVHVLLDAFRLVARRHPDARLDLIGTPGLLAHEMLVGLSRDPVIRGLDAFYGDTFMERLKRRVLGKAAAYADDLRARLDPESAHRVHFHGFVPHTELADRYRAADVFVFPSVCHEAFGLPVAEAMACGVPVVAAASGGVKEIVVPGETGLLVPRGDAEALADALLALLADPARRHRFGAAGQARTGRLFSWDHVAGVLRGEYERLTAPAAALPEAA